MGAWRVTGKLSEEGTVTIGERSVQTKNRTFSTVVTLNKPGSENVLELIVTDRAENRGEFRKTVDPTLSLLVDPEYKGNEGEGGRFRSIQSAISKSSRSHIIVKPGVYRDKLDIDGELTLIGRGRPKARRTTKPL